MELKETKIGWSRVEIAQNVARDIPDASYVNLGIGLPELVADHVRPAQVDEEEVESVSLRQVPVHRHVPQVRRPDLPEGLHLLAVLLPGQVQVPGGDEGVAGHRTHRSQHALVAHTARSDLLLVRPALGIAPFEVDRIVGRTLQRDMLAGEPLQWSDV